jgi:SAM-dependent methyltransferase
MNDLPDPIVLRPLATKESFSEAGYLSANPDVRAAVAKGVYSSGAVHFKRHGAKEGRRQDLDSPPNLSTARAEKLARVLPFIRSDMEWQWCAGRMDFLTDALREESHISDTENVSALGYDAAVGNLIARHRGGLVLDCGAGLRDAYYRDVVNFEIVDYPTTDVLGVGENLPFIDGTFDAVISVAVLEHVRDPFRCAQEISRVLKTGGELFCAIPFLQPMHGFPHHYFNATPQGIRRLFEDTLEVKSVTVFPSTHPIQALYWILRSWDQGLEPSVAKRFRAMTVKELLRDPYVQVQEPFCTSLPIEKQFELACATVLTAVK